jgi:ubiquitin-conjugating enzyme E2 D
LHDAKHARVSQELHDFQNNPSSEFSAGSIDDDLFHWQGAIVGPVRTISSILGVEVMANSTQDGSPYEGGRFVIDLRFPPDYPFKAPRVKFLTKIYHPNIVSPDTNLLCFLTTGHWQPHFTAAKGKCSFLTTKSLDFTQISQVFMEFLSLLASPDVDDSLLPNIGHQYKNDYDVFFKTAQEWTRS